MLALFALFGLALSILVIVWDRHHEARLERRRSGWLASFYDAPTSKEPRR